MAKQIIPCEIKIGDRLRIEQRFEDGSYVLVVGVVKYSWEDFVSFEHEPRVAYNLDPFDGMPYVLIHRLD